MGIPFKKNGIDGVVMRYMGQDPVRVFDMTICPGSEYKVTTYDDVIFGTSSIIAEVTIVDGLGVCLRYESNEEFEADWRISDGQDQEGHLRQVPEADEPGQGPR